MNNLADLKEQIGKVSLKLLTFNKLNHYEFEDDTDKDLVDFEILLDMLPKHKIGKLLMIISQKMIRG